MVAEPLQRHTTLDYRIFFTSLIPVPWSLEMTLGTQSLEEPTLCCLECQLLKLHASWTSQRQKLLRRLGNDRAETRHHRSDQTMEGPQARHLVHLQA